MMGDFSFTAEELRDIILGKAIITKCPDCGCYSQWGRLGEIPDDGDGNIIPWNLVQDYIDKCDDDGLPCCYWSLCETCEGLGYLIKFT
jgi:hypothetical protein